MINTNTRVKYPTDNAISRDAAEFCMREQSNGVGGVYVYVCDP